MNLFERHASVVANGWLRFLVMRICMQGHPAGLAGCALSDCAP
jgi:hypothetical protein